MGDVVERGGEVVRLLESGAFDDVLGQVAAEVREALPDGVLSRWSPGVQGAIGSEREIDGVEEVDERAVRVMLRGDRGTLAVTVRFDEQAKLVALGVTPRVAVDGIRNIVIGCPYDESAARRLADFYAAVLDFRIVREDWLKVGKDIATYPHLAFGDGWEDERPPRWSDPDYPHQAHLEVETSDVDAAIAQVLAAGGEVLERDEGRVVVADPYGHPLYVRPTGGASANRLAALTWQCADPEPLAVFWGALLDLPERPESSADRIVISSSAGEGVMLAFERVPNYVAPRWHNPAFPEQLHVDLHFNDPEAARKRAEELGATPLPPPRGSCPVYADPAGHPFCLCSSGGGETVPYLPVIGQ